MLLLYKPVESNANYNQMQEAVTTIDHWMHMFHNFLMLNAAKCKHNHGNNKEQDTL